MLLLRSKTIKITILVLLVLIISFSFAAISFLNFPLIYHQETQERTITFLIAMFGFSFLTLFAIKSFLLPYLSEYIKLQNLIFIVILIIFLTATITTNLNYYWSVPVTHNIEICFDADDADSTIIFRELVHPVTNRLYPPDSFGTDRYPLLLESGGCLNGSVMTFYRRIMRFWNKPGITVLVQEDPPDGRLYVSVNEVPTVVYFNQNAETQPNNEIVFNDGFDLGNKVETPWNQYWFWGIRVLAVFISAIFLSLFFFGLAERIITFSSVKLNQRKQIKVPLLKRIHITKLPLYKILLAITIIYFIIFGIFMAYTSGQPDQAPHRYYSIRFTETWGIPKDDPDSPYVITGQPYLAYWLNGAVFKIHKMLFPNSQIRLDQLWRFVSVSLSSFTVLYIYKLASKVSGNPYAGVLAAFFLSNTLMFVFISGGISYDNLMNLAGMAAIYHLISLYKKEDFLRHTALMGIWVVVGALSKEQFLLMTLIIFLVWVFFVIRNFRNIRLNFNRTNKLLTSILFVAIVLFIGLYGINFTRYSTTTPSCLQIKGEGHCGTYVYRQEFYNQISYPGLWFNRDKFQNPINYAFDFWFMLMIQSTWGIFSHNTFIPKLATALHSILILWSFICLARYWKIKDIAANVLIYILLVFVGYVFLWNYKLDIEYNFHHYGVTGRYLFPSIGAFFTLMVYYFLKIRSVLLKKLTIMLAIILNFTGGLWIFLSRYSEVFIHWRIYF